MPYLGEFGLLVEDVTPDNGAEDVSVATNVQIQFSAPMDSGSISTSTIWLLDEQGNKVSATVSYDSVDRIATITPDENLDPSTRYQGVVIGGSQGVLDIDGDTLMTDYNWNFTTSSESVLAAPALLSPSNQSLTSVATPEFKWNPVEDAAEYEIWISKEPGFGSLEYDTIIPDSGESPITHTPGQALQSATNTESLYYWRVRAISEDGSPGVWSKYWMFNNATYSGSTQDDEWLEVIAISPSKHYVMDEGEESNPIEIVFSEAVDEDTVGSYIKVFVEEL